MCGIDHNLVVSNSVRTQVSAEDTFPEDIPLVECETHIRRLAEKVWNASKGNARQARTVVLKLKTKEFSSLTRSLTPRMPISARAAPSAGWCGLRNFQFGEDATDGAATLDLLKPVAELLLQAQW
jgi:nucleotidyltransferase/DNA polymerase involved in DNA repair